MSKKTSSKKCANNSPKKAVFSCQPTKKTPQPAIYSPEFNDLQAEWDKKLAASGFKDIEQRATSPAGETLYFNDKSLKAIGKSYNKEQEHFYARLTNYLTFNKQIPDGYGGYMGATKQLACRLYAEGHSYRSILKQLKGRPGPALNLYSLSNLIREFINISTIWNASHYQGLDFIPDI